MPLTSEITQGLIRAGRFAEVQAEFKASSGSLHTLSQEHRVALALALHQAGNTGAAIEIAKFENTPNSPSAVRSRCEYS